MIGAYGKDQAAAAPGQSSHTYQAVAPGEEVCIVVGDEKAHVFNVGRAHSSNDCVVFLEKRRVLAAGDLVFVNWHPPFMDPEGSVSSWNIALAVVEARYDADIIVPGHGAIADHAAMSTMQEYFRSITESIGDRSKLRSLRARYRHYISMPFITGFDKTVAFIEREMTADH